MIHIWYCCFELSCQIMIQIVTYDTKLFSEYITFFKEKQSGWDDMTKKKKNIECEKLTKYWYIINKSMKNWPLDETIG